MAAQQQQQVTPERVAATMLSWHDDGGDLELVSCRKIQTLWAGYGSICEVRARRRGSPETLPPMILKLVAPPRTTGTGAGGDYGEDEDEGHLRKMLSYEVEQYFYEVLAPRLSPPSSSPAAAKVARCIATTRNMSGKPGAELLSGGGGIVATLLADLRSEFPVPGDKRAELSEPQVRAALDWLAGFHGASRAWVAELAGEGEGEEMLVRPPLEEVQRRSGRGGDRARSVWLNGGYTYLATRRKEYAALAADSGSEWSAALCGPFGDAHGRSVAERVADFLAPRSAGGGGGGGGQRRPQESCIHGDVKSENLFATAAGDRVAFFDFQYVGLGLGVCDLAKLFTCSVPLRLLAGRGRGGGIPRELEMGAGERGLLEYYRGRLLESGEGGWEYGWDLFVRHWEAALVDWLRFQMSWGAWGNTEWLEARVRSILADDGFKAWLLDS